MTGTLGTDLLALTAAPAGPADHGDRSGLLLVVAALIGAGWAFYRIVVPLLRATVAILERVAQVAIKLGLALMAVGAAAAVVLVLYAMTSLSGSGSG
jgi:hypothetical protein